jgi:sugar/nucleoside kinase (ribokinase family)
VAGEGGFVYGLKAGLKGAAIVALGAAAASLVRRALRRR